MLITGIGELVTNDPTLGLGALGVVNNAAVVIDDGHVAWLGDAAAVPEGVDEPRLDVGERCVLPGFVDAHTHLVFAGDRAGEFSARLNGERYDGGGIRTTVRQTRAASTEALRAQTQRLAAEALRSGTTTMEIKSGYGLTVDDERRLLDVACGLGDDAPAIVPTFLGAHVVPEEYAGRPDDYVTLVAGEMLDACAPPARWCDVFCEDSAFDRDRARTVLSAARDRGLGLRLHANQLEHGAGAQLASEIGARSADHLTHLKDDDITALSDADVVATLLPAAEFSTRSPYAPARRLLDAGVTVALATDCNPGTSYTTSMPFVIALACVSMHMSPEEAVLAATQGGARSLELDDVGHLGVGAVADLVVLDAPSYVHLAYRPGTDIVSTVVRAGRVVREGHAHG